MAPKPDGALVLVATTAKSADKAPAKTPARRKPVPRKRTAVEKTQTTAGLAAIAAAGAKPLPAKADAELIALDQRARAGESAAQLELAEYWISGLPGEKPDLARSIYWYQKAAENGEADASWALASFYRDGQGVPADLDQAIDWYQTAAEQGHAQAMFDLGLLYSEGALVEPDPGLAAEWFELAADQGVAPALYLLGTLYERGVDGAPDLDTALAWYRRSAESGDTTALDAIARLESGQRNVALAGLPEGALAPETVTSTAARPLKPATAATTTAAATAATTLATAPSSALLVDRKGIQEIQNLLKARGYRVGTANGYLGSRTVVAIRAYQKTQGLPPDGKASRALLDRLRRG